MSPEPATRPAGPVPALPPVRRAHLAELSALGPIGQHAVGPRPDPAHGSCTDDVARALEVDLLHAAVIGWEAVEGSAWDALRYLDEAVDEDSGRFRNFRGVEGDWLEAIGSEDSHGRAVLALGRAMATAPDRAFRSDAAGIFRRTLPGTVGLTFMHARSSALIGCAMAAGADLATGSHRAWTAVGARLAGIARGRVRAGRLLGDLAVARVAGHLRVGADAASPDRGRPVDGRSGVDGDRARRPRLAREDRRRPGRAPVPGRQPRLVAGRASHAPSSTSSPSRPSRTSTPLRRRSTRPAIRATWRTRSGPSAGTWAGTTSASWSPIPSAGAVTTASGRAASTATRVRSRRSPGWRPWSGCGCCVAGGRRRPVDRARPRSRPR